MAAFAKSRERLSVSFTSGDGTITTNLTKGQDETKCSAHYTVRTTSDGADRRENHLIKLVMVDNGGTPAVQATRNGSGTVPGLVVEIEVIEWGDNVTVQQGSVTISGTSITAPVANIGTVDRGFVIPTYCKSPGGGNSDVYSWARVRASFNSATQIQFDRNAGGIPLDISYFVISSNGTDFLTEYVDYTMASSETGPTNQTLSNTVDLDASFLIVTSQTSENGDDMRDAIAHMALTGTSQATIYRDHGAGPQAIIRFGAWVVRCSPSDVTVQRFATDVSGTLTNDQTITSSSLDATTIFNGDHIANGHIPINASSNGNHVEDLYTAIWQTSTTNIRTQRFKQPTFSSVNPFARFEVVEFELEAGIAPPQTVPVGVVSETDSVFEVTPKIISAPQTVPVGLISETDTVDEVKPIAGAVSVSVGLVSETDTVFTVTPELGGAPQIVVVEAIGETDSVFEAKVVPGAVSVPVGLISEADSVLDVKVVPGAFSVSVGTITETDGVAPVFPVIEGGPQTVLVVNVAEVDTVFPVTPRVATIGGRNQEEDFWIGVRIGI